MAITQRGNSFYITSTGAVTTEVNYKIKGIIFTPDAANDNVVLQETASTSVILNIKAATAKDTIFYDFSKSPIVFPTGIYCSTLSSNAVVTLIVEK